MRKSYTYATSFSGQEQSIAPARALSTIMPGHRSKIDMAE